MSDQTLRLTNREIEECGTILPIVTGRKNRNYVIVFLLAKIHKTIAPILEAFSQARREISLEYAQKDGDGEVKYAKNDEGMETGNFAIDPRRMKEHQAELNKLLDEVNVIHGLKKLSVKSMIEGWKVREKDKDGKKTEEVDEGVEPALIVGLAPFLELDMDDLDSPMPASVAKDKKVGVEAVHEE